VADPNQIKQVFFNLLTNAIQALKEVDKPRELRVSSEVGLSKYYEQADNPTRYIRLLFEDSGPGISPVILRAYLIHSLPLKERAKVPGSDFRYVTGSSPSTKGIFGLKMDQSRGLVSLLKFL
jgi:hypothetical protein